MKVFISYAREDSLYAKKLYLILKRADTDPWLDTENILPGEKWKIAISRAIKESVYFLALLSSNSVSKKGYVQKELKIAMDFLDELPQQGRFLIPVRIDNCKIDDEKLMDIQWVDLFPSFKEGVYKILNAILPDKDCEKIDINDLIIAEKYTTDHVEDIEKKYLIEPQNEELILKKYKTIVVLSKENSDITFLKTFFSQMRFEKVIFERNIDNALTIDRADLLLLNDENQNFEENEIMSILQLTANTTVCVYFGRRRLPFAIDNRTSFVNMRIQLYPNLMNALRYHDLLKYR